MLTMKGSAMCNYSKEFTAEQEFFVQERDLIGSKGAEPREIEVGTYTFEFHHRLPRNIPYSVEGVYGFIKYLVIVTLDLPWEITDKSVEKSFIVKRYEDLNYMSGMRDPREVITRKEIDSPSWIFWKAATGYVIIRGGINQCGYAPGEKINIDVEVNNQSTVEIENVTLSLMCNTNYSCQTPWAKLEKKTELKLSEVLCQAVKAGYVAKIKESVNIPLSIPISSVMYCNVYQICYVIQISLKFKKWNNSVTLDIPVYIGSVGLKPVDELDENVRIPPLWPPNLKVEDGDRENAEKLTFENIDSKESTIEATD
jgi:hypothetical protein